MRKKALNFGIIIVSSAIIPSLVSCGQQSPGNLQNQFQDNISNLKTEVTNLKIRIETIENNLKDLFKKTLEDQSQHEKDRQIIINFYNQTVQNQTDNDEVKIKILSETELQDIPKIQSALQQFQANLKDKMNEKNARITELESDLNFWNELLRKLGQEGEFQKIVALEDFETSSQQERVAHIENQLKKLIAKEDEISTAHQGLDSLNDLLDVGKVALEFKIFQVTSKKNSEYETWKNLDSKIKAELGIEEPTETFGTTISYQIEKIETNLGQITVKAKIQKNNQEQVLMVTIKGF